MAAALLLSIGARTQQGDGRWAMGVAAAVHARDEKQSAGAAVVVLARAKSQGGSSDQRRILPRIEEL